MTFKISAVSIMGLLQAGLGRLPGTQHQEEGLERQALVDASALCTHRAVLQIM